MLSRQRRNGCQWSFYRCAVRHSGKQTESARKEMHCILTGRNDGTIFTGLLKLQSTYKTGKTATNYYSIKSHNS